MIVPASFEVRDQRTRILVLTSSFPSREFPSTCRFVAEWVTSLSQFADVTVLAPPGAALPDDLSASGVQLHCFAHLPENWKPRLRADTDLRRMLETKPAAWVEFLPFHREFYHQALCLAAQTDVVCSHWLVPSAVIGHAVSRKRNLPHVMIEHSGGLRLLNQVPGGVSLLKRMIDRSASCITVSQELKTRLVERLPQGAEKIIVLPMGVADDALTAREWSKAELRAALGLPDSKLVLFFLGRHVEIKGLPVVLKALEHQPDVHLIVAGDGPCRTQWEHEALRRGVAATFLGEVSGAEKWRWLAAADVMVLPSLEFKGGRTEGTPVVCLEALTVGTPVMAAAVGGIPEHIQTGINGWLLPAGDVAAWRAQINRLATDRAHLENVSRVTRSQPAPHVWSHRGKEFAEMIGIPFRNGTPVS
ncbi:MAG: glycosyltransferase family 4 protein [Acidobacteria bacterium]|nr:glycosyltransferase family 4 protein [Acidobacteriota bacterium]